MRRWTPIIPKSVLFILLNSNEGDKTSDNWGLDILIKPNEKMILILLVDAVFLLMLGLIIIILHLLEKVSFLMINKFRLKIEKNLNPLIISDLISLILAFI